MQLSLDLALLGLDGLSTGDAFGQLFFRRPLPGPRDTDLPPGPWAWTDDTHMALSIVETLAAGSQIDQDTLAIAFARRYQEQPWRGYAPGASSLLAAIGRGEQWHERAPALFGTGSFGNGGAMRAGPIGGFFARRPRVAAEQAGLAAAVTHAHPEGQAGAMAVAAAASLAADKVLTGVAFIRAVLEFVPESITMDAIEAAAALPAADIGRAVAELGSGQRVSAQDTVPFCIWSAAHHLEDFASAMWSTVRAGGDRDTTCAIVGGIVALSTGAVPPGWLARREPLPPIPGLS
jgi:ADP-ribosylglycohydrolase